MTAVTVSEAKQEVDVRAVHAASRAGAVAVLASCATTGLLGAPASASTSVTATPPAVSTNWYWAQAAPTVNGTGLPAAPPAAASGVADGDLGVGYVADQTGNPDKLAAVGFDITQIPLGATFSSFVVTVPLDAAANQLKNAVPALSACENIDTFPDGAGPTDIAKAPPLSLLSCVKGEFKTTIGKGGGYVFDLTAIANDWSGGAPADGITIRPTPGVVNPEPFTLSLLGKNSITSEAVYSPPDAPVVAPLPVTDLPGTVAPPPALTGVALPPVVPQIDAPQTLPQAAPLLPAPQVNPAPQAAVPAASAAYSPGALTPSTNWWLAFLGALGLLGLTSMVLGDPMPPVVVDSRRRRFAGVVRSRAQVSPTQTRPAAPRTRFRPA